MIKEFGYEYDAELDKALWNKTRGKVTYEKIGDAECLRSGRDALKAIAREFLPMKVFIPALACDSMSHPFKTYGHEIIYYRLNEDYSIDLTYLEKIIDNGIFLYMDYFGIKAISDERLENLKNKYNLCFIEDRTHNLIWKRKSNFKPDYIIASLRKWINVPDGGLLWCNRELTNKQFSDDTLFSETRLKAQYMRNEFLRTGNESLKLEYRKIFSAVSKIMDQSNIPSRMSAYSYEIANTVNWETICKVRSANAEALISTLNGADVCFVQNASGYSDLYVSFLTENRDKIQNRLSQKGIFNTVIWPLTNEQKNVCQVAKITEECMLAAPCDQRYTIEDMWYIGNEICKAIREECK